MDDESKNKHMEKNVSGQPFSSFFNVGVVFQSFWVRCRSIFLNVVDREFMESQLRVVLYCGSIFWIIYLLSQII